eukprot:3430128-Rhodomonas_salina.1
MPHHGRQFASVSGGQNAFKLKSEARESMQKLSTNGQLESTLVCPELLHSERNVGERNRSWHALGRSLGVELGPVVALFLVTSLLRRRVDDSADVPI